MGPDRPGLYAVPGPAGLDGPAAGWVLVYPQPDRCWSTNDERRWHWSKRSSLVTAWRDQTHDAALVFRLGLLEGRWEVTAVLPFTRNVRRDPHNYVSGPVKAAVDGLVLAGVFPDDSPDYVTVAEPRIRITKDRLVVLCLAPAGTP